MVLHAGQGLGYRNSDQRSGEFLRAAGALLNGVHHFVTIIRSLINKLLTIINGKDSSTIQPINVVIFQNNGDFNIAFLPIVMASQ